MGIIDWAGAKVVKYGYGFKGVTSKDIKMLRKIFPISDMGNMENMTKEDAYDIYLNTKVSDLERIVKIVRQNKKAIMKQIKNASIEFSMGDINRIIRAMEDIVKAKKENKPREELEKIVDRIINQFSKTNPEWFNEANFREDTVLRL